MNHQFKPGDQALIIASPRRNNPNVGRCVELLRLVMPGETGPMPCGRGLQNVSDRSAWMCYAPGLLLGGRDAGGIDLILPERLSPLRGDFELEHQKAKEAEPCA